QLDSLYTDIPPPWTHPLSLHDALPISPASPRRLSANIARKAPSRRCRMAGSIIWASARVSPTPMLRPPCVRVLLVWHPLCLSPRSEEHTSELQSRENLVCRLLLEKKKK